MGEGFIALTGLATQQEFAPVPVEVRGSHKLRKQKHELFAQAIAALKPNVVAYREAGLGGKDYHADRGNAARLLRRHDVKDRVEYFGEQHNDVMKLKSRALERFQWMILTANVADYYESIPGQREPKLRPFSELTEDQQLMIESLKFTEKGKPILTLKSSMQAHTNLVKMLGVGMADREAIDSEFSHYNRDELFAEIAREAKELGIDVEFTFRANGAA